jgi:hypothetical protein
MEKQTGQKNIHHQLPQNPQGIFADHFNPDEEHTRQGNQEYGNYGFTRIRQEFKKFIHCSILQKYSFFTELQVP